MDDKLEDTYRSHPLSADRIIRRLDRDYGNRGGLTEIDLAVDPLTEVTDQNHVGGLAATLELGRDLGLTSNDRLLDVGSGLGGSIRALAFCFGSKTVGVELLPFRAEDSHILSAMVKLDGQCTTICQDFLEFDDAVGFSAIISQGSICHFADRDQVFSKCADLLCRGGSLIVEDTALAIPDLSGEVRTEVAELEQIWNTELTTIEAWKSALLRARLNIVEVGVLNSRAICWFRRCVAAAERAGDAFPARELRGMQLGLSLLEKGVIDYFRIKSRLSEELGQKR